MDTIYMVVIIVFVALIASISILSVVLSKQIRKNRIEKENSQAAISEIRTRTAKEISDAHERCEAERRQ